MPIVAEDIDEIDAKILKTLLKDARTSFAKIAQECGVSNNTIVKHFHKLQKSGVITGTSLITTLKDFGYQFPLAADINVVAGKEQEILEALKKIPNFRACHQVIGKYDVHATFYVENIEEIEKIRDILKNQKSITRVGLTATLSELSYHPENFLIEPTEKKKNG
jgi:DNA-binding Lrp family transcriptional regulator